jgi:two-component system, sensor histidine kinase
MNEQSFDTGTDTEQWLLSIIRAAPTGIGVVRDRLILQVNEKICEMTGYRSEELVGQSARMLYPTQEDFDYVGREKYRQIQQKNTGTVESRWRRKDGSLIDVLLSSTPMNPADLSKGVTFTALDISERKQAERKVLVYQKRLQELVAQLTITEEQERKRIATELHDEISQPLALAKMSVDAALAVEREPERVSFLSDMQTSLESLLTKTQWLTRDLGAPSLCEFGLEVAVREWLSHEVEKKYAIAVNVESNRTKRSLDDTTKTLIFRVIRELAINVIKHAQARHLDISITQQNGQLKICVSDDGIGFNPEDAEFTSAQQGGYGLFSIKERVTHMGGTVDIQSCPGQGAQVVLQLPCPHKTAQNA